MTEVEKFYEWLLKIQSIHLADNQKMVKAFEKLTSQDPNHRPTTDHQNIYKIEITKNPIFTIAYLISIARRAKGFAH